ncbi:MAG: cupin domain-containing protein [Leptospiraceae bacterium]
MDDMTHQLAKNPVHLGLGATAEVEPAITGMEWYAGYIERHKTDGNEGRLVAEHTFSEPWDSWEMHPEGSELVYCIRGEIDLIQEVPGTTRRIKLRSGEYAINEPGVWHTADVTESCTVLFITSGLGTQHRQRT